MQHFHYIFYLLVRDLPMWQYLAELGIGYYFGFSSILKQLFNSFWVKFFLGVTVFGLGFGFGFGFFYPLAFKINFFSRLVNFFCTIWASTVYGVRPIFVYSLYCTDTPFAIIKCCSMPCCRSAWAAWAMSCR